MNCIKKTNFITNRISEGGIHIVSANVGRNSPCLEEGKKIVFAASEPFFYRVFASFKSNDEINVYYACKVYNGELSLARFEKDNDEYISQEIPLGDYNIEGVIKAVSFGLGEENQLVMHYIYEGALATAIITIPDSNYKELTGMDFTAGVVVESQDSIVEVAFFENFEEYYHFIQTYNNSIKIRALSKKIENIGKSTNESFPSSQQIGNEPLSFGQEYLYNILNKIVNNEPFNVVFTGDSTTAYYQNTSDGLEIILKNCFLKANINTGTFYNNGVSGINAQEWKEKYLAGDLALSPDLYIIRHGFNNCSGETLEEMAESFEKTMRKTLATIRERFPVAVCSIVLMTPNSSNDDEHNRGYAMKELINPIIRNLAREFGCGFIDTFKIWYDAGAYLAEMYDNPFGNGAHIHPNGLMNRLFISKLFDFVCPIAFRK